MNKDVAKKIVLKYKTLSLKKSGLEVELLQVKEALKKIEYDFLPKIIEDESEIKIKGIGVFKRKFEVYGSNLTSEQENFLSGRAEIKKAIKILDDEKLLDLVKNNIGVVKITKSVHHSTMKKLADEFASNDDFQKLFQPKKYFTINFD